MASSAEILSWLAYASLPVMSALVGWGTNWLALKMTFYPLEPIGWPPWFGWQGIIPSKAAKMAKRSVELMTEQLVTVDDIVSRLDPDRVAQVLEPALELLVRRLADEMFEEHAAKLWNRMPRAVREQFYKRALKETPEVTRRVIEEMHARSGELFDLEEMVVEALVRDKALLNELFLRCGREELKFIERSGLGFGFLFGLVQAIIWFLAPVSWFLPVAGFVVGYATNWIALKMIFEPVSPIRIGPFVWQGMFLKRQKEVATEYAALTASEILSSRNILTAILRGPTSDTLFEVIQRHASEGIDRSVGAARRVVTMAIGAEEFSRLKARACRDLFEELPGPVAQLEVYASEALDLDNTLREKLVALPPDDFIGLLRPVFQEDELKLILVGAALGTCVGLFQLLVIFGRAFGG